MNRLIRCKVFETNSSSCHSFSVSNYPYEVLDTILPDSEGNIYLKGGSYGWEWEKTNSAIEKANYCLVALWNLDYRKPVDYYVNHLIEIIKTQTGAKEVILLVDICTYGPYDYDKFYIDEGGSSIENFTDTFLDNDDNLDKEKLRRFIFDKNSFLFLGNDNSKVPEGFYKLPVFKENREFTPITVVGKIYIPAMDKDPTKEETIYLFSIPKDLEEVRMEIENYLFKKKPKFNSEGKLLTKEEIKTAKTAGALYGIKGGLRKITQEVFYVTDNKAYTQAIREDERIYAETGNFGDKLEDFYARRSNIEEALKSKLVIAIKYQLILL